MKRNYMVWFGVLLLLLQLPVLAQDNLRVQYRDGNAVPDFLNICGDPDQVAVTVRVEGTTLTERRNILATLHLFKGTQLLALDTQNSSPGVTLLDATDLSKPVFSLPDLSPTALQNVTIAYTVAANCALLDTLLLDDQAMVFDQWELNYNMGTASNLTEIENTAEYRDALAIPAFTLAIENPTDAARVGNCYTRDIIIDNSALDGFVNQLTYENKQQIGISIQQLAVNGESVAFTKDVDTQGDTLIQLDIIGALFANNSNGNGDNLFDPNERLVITETYCVSSCESGRESVHTIGWGCYDRMCQTISDNDFVAIGEGTANVQIAKGGRLPDTLAGYCATGQTTITISNQGVEIDPGFAAMTDVQMGVGLGSGFELSVAGYTVTGFQIGTTTVAASSAIVMLDDNPLFASDPDGDGGLSDIDGDGFFDDLAAGTTLELTAFYEFDCTQAATTDEGNCTNDFAVAFNARVDYTNQCEERLLRVQPNFFRPANNNAGFENTTTPDADVEEDVFFITHRERRTIRDFAVSCDGAETLVATVTLPDGITPVIDQTTLRRNELTSVTLLDADVLNGVLVLTYDASAFNFLLGDYELNMAFTADCNAQSGATNFPFTFELVCPSCDCRHLWFCDNLSGPTLHLRNPPCDNVASCNDGIQTTGFQVNRTTFGFTDNTYTQRIKSDDANQKVAIACDSVSMRVTNVVGNASISDNIGVVIAYDNIETTANPNIQTFLFGQGSVFIQQNMQTVECLVTAADLTVTPTDAGTELNFDLSRCLRERGLQLNEGDQVDFVGNFYVNPDGGYTTQFRTIPNFRAYGYAIKDGETIICDSYGDSFTLAKTQTVFDFPNTNFFPQGCESQPLQYRLVTINNGFRDFFDDELRRSVLVDSLVFEYDPNILAAFESVELEASIPDHPIHGDNFFPLPPLSSFELGRYVARFDTLRNASPYNNVTAYAFNVRLKLTPTCRSEFGSRTGDNRYRLDPTIYYHDRFYAASLGDGDCSPVIIDAQEDNILYEDPPQFTLNPLGVTNYQLLGDTAIWTVQHCNTSFDSDANTTFIAIEDTTGMLEVVSIEDLSDPSNPIPLDIQSYSGAGNSYFAITPALLKADGQNALPDICNTLRIKATVNRCDATTFQVKTGWNCADFPIDWTPLVYPPCDEQQLALSVTPLSPFLAANIIKQPTENPTICDEDEVTILVRNTDLGTAFDLRTRLSFPAAGPTLVPGSVEIAYPSDTAFRPAATDPVLVADDATGKTYEYADFSALHPTLADNGLAGFDPANLDASNEFQLRYRFSTACGIESGQLLFYNFQGVKGCGEMTNFEAGETRPIVIRGTEDDFSKLLEVAFSTQSGLNAEGGVAPLEIEVTNRTAAPTDETDMLVMVLPQGITYVNNSSTSNFGEPSINIDTLGRQELVWDLPIGMTQDETVRLGIEVNAPDVNCENNENIAVTLKTISTEQLLCERDNESCTVQTLTSTTGEELTNLPTNRSGLVFDIRDFSATCLSDNREEVNVRGTLSDISEDSSPLGMTLDIVYHLDENSNGQYDEGELEIGRFVENNSLPLEFEHRILTDNNQVCGWIVRVDETSTSTDCGVAAAVLDVPKLRNAGDDQIICTTDSSTVIVELGQTTCPPENNYIYEWRAIAPATLDNFSDISNANPNVTFIHDGQSVRQFRYVLATTRDNCGTSLDTVQITLSIGLSITPPTPMMVAVGDSITLQPNIMGGTPPLTYQWEPAALLSATDIPNPVAMPNEDTQYRLNVTDANGCTAEAIFPILISECRPATVTTISTNSTICGEAEGSANIQLEQPISDYTFRWMPDLGQATETEARRSNLPAGGYRVQIIAIGDTSCVTEAVVVIENTDAPTAQADVQAATCQSNTGQANLQPTSFDYLWEDGSTLSQRADLVAGTYLITVTDPTRPDCSNTLQVVISNQNVLSTTASIDQAPDCGQSNGEVSIAAMGGSGDYTYLWADSTTTATRTDLPSGIYSVTVTDNSPTNCTAVVNFTLTDAVSVATISNLNATDITCNGDSNGRLSFEITFDDDFSFPADTIFTQEERTVANGALMAGQVCLTILDANGCVAGGECIAIGEPEVLQVTLNTTQGCQSDGTISGAISGGTMPYVVNWQDLTESDNALNRTNLMSGTYTLTITDANDCILENTVVVPACPCAPPRLTSIQTTAANCETSNGAIRLQIERPEDYVFTWLPDIGTANETGNRRTGLPSGGYQIRIAERNNPACDTIVSAIITPDLALDITQSISAASCANSDGAVLLSPADFEYEWADNMTTNERSDLATGVYFVTVTDPERPDCPQVEEVRIGEDNDLTAAITINQMPNCGESNGSVTLNVMGGSGNYTYSWESATATQDGLAAGVYPITITDNAGAGCILPFTFLLLDDVAAATVEVITVRDISCTGLQDGRLDFSVEFDEEFVAPAQIFITDGNSELVNGSLAAGDYCLQINDGNGCVAGGTCFTIAEPNPIVLDVTLTSACDSTGSIVINPTGGVAPYRFDWSDIEGTDNPKDRTDLNTGSYAVTVTDANDCTLVETDIQLDTCQVCDLFMTDTSFVQTSDCLGTAKFCFDLDAADVPNYEISINNMPYNSGLGRCEFDTLGIYSFITLLNSVGPYDLDSWTINGMVQTSTFDNIAALVDTMNVLDPLGNWMLSEDGLLATGGFSGNTYGALNISNADGVQASIGYNTGFSPRGYSIDLPIGTHDVVFSNTITGCTASVFVEVVCVQTDTIRIELEVGDDEVVCLDDTDLEGAIDTIFNSCPVDNVNIAFGDSCVTFTGVATGMNTACIVACDERRVCDTTIVIIDVSPAGIVDTIVVGQQTEYCFDEDLGNFTGPLSTIQNLCPELSGQFVDFTLDDTSFCVIYEGLDIGTNNACIEVCDVNGVCDSLDFAVTVVEGDVIYDTLYINNGGDVVCLGNNVPGSITGITDRCSDKNGAHVDFQINLITNCVTYDPVSIGTDTACIVITDNMGNEHRTNFIITVRAITPEFINDTIFINQTIIYCADTSELPGEIVSIDNFCPAESGEFVDFFLDPSSMCVEYTGLEIGQDSACIVFCDINGLCDTTFITTTVVEYFEPPIAMNDTARTTRGTPVVIDVKENDLVFGGVDTAFVVTPPLYGTARLNLDCSITYEPNERFCDRSDEFEYVVCNPNGCDTAKVEVFIECVGIFVFNAVSPNGDGSNDTFFIAGLDDKPENNLKIFNRWGNLVYETNNYQNTWDGTWDADKDLPDGTYFYILTIDDNGTESVFRGYLELFR